jgi:hypothetical protein
MCLEREGRGGRGLQSGPRLARIKQFVTIWEDSWLLQMK